MLTNHGERLSPQSRGIALTVAAVVVGTLLLTFGADDWTQAGRPTRAEVPTPTDRRDAAAVPVEDTAPVAADLNLRAPNEVRILVANGTGRSGAAALIANQLVASGYNGLPPTNTNPSAELAPSALHVANGYEDDAQVIAKIIGIDPERLTEMPADPPVNDLLDANILIVVGEDLLAPGT